MVPEHVLIAPLLMISQDNINELGNVYTAVLWGYRLVYRVGLSCPRLSVRYPAEDASEATGR